MIDRLEIISTTFDRLNAWFGEKISYFIYPIIGVIVLEVFLRYGLDSPTSWGHDLSVQLFGVYIALIGGFTLLHKGHVNMDLVLNRLPPRGGAILNLVSYSLCFLFLGTLLWKGAEAGYTSVLILERSPNPSDFTIYIFPLRVTVVVGTLLFLLEAIAVYLRNLVILIRGSKLNDSN